MDYSKVKYNIINLLEIHFDQTGHTEMEIAEIASHLKMPVDHIKNVIVALTEDGMVRTTLDGKYATLLQKGESTAE